MKSFLTTGVDPWCRVWAPEKVNLWCFAIFVVGCAIFHRCHMLFRDTLVFAENSFLYIGGCAMSFNLETFVSLPSLEGNKEGDILAK